MPLRTLNVEIKCTILSKKSSDQDLSYICVSIFQFFLNNKLILRMSKIKPIVLYMPRHFFLSDMGLGMLINQSIMRVQCVFMSNHFLTSLLVDYNKMFNLKEFSTFAQSPKNVCEITTLTVFSFGGLGW